MTFSIGFHEMGHLLACKVFTKNEVWHIKIGIGKEIVKTKRITLCAIPFSGYFRYEEKRAVSTFEEGSMLVGGPLGTALLLLLLALILRNVASAWSVSLAKYLIYFNGSMLITSVVPMRYSAVFNPIRYSDGWQFWQLVRKNNN
ncbi:MAG: hypothetical protein E7277_03255 [Lachnospiraceae bacterium]|nr:hypothetical protein [Lachnospiraceae bacterium]